MHQWIALLKGINVGGHNKIAMATLKQAATRAGFEHFQTYIQSGNCVFSHEGNQTHLADKLRAIIRQEFGLDIKVLVLPLGRVQQIVANNPFELSDADDNKLQIHFCWQAPSKDFASNANALAIETEQFQLIDDIVYLYAPDGIGRSKLFAQLPKLMGVEVTVRNLRTINKLISMV